MVDLIAIFSKCASMCLLLLIVETEMVTAPTHAHHTVIANWVTLCPPDKSESSMRIRVQQTRWPALISITMPDQGLPAWATSASNLCYGGLRCHLNPSEVGKMLCPVKQLKLYLRDLGTNLGGRQRLFIHWNWNSTIRDIMRSHISRWIVETVTGVYTGADREYDHVTAHEVRALSASWAYNCRVALPDILSAAFRRSPGVLRNSYRGDMACIADWMSTLGPMVVAQQVVFHSGSRTKVFVFSTLYLG